MRTLHDSQATARQRAGRCTLPLLVLAALAAGPAQGQSLADRVARVANGAVRFHYPAAADVCGDGETIIRFRGTAERGYSVMRQRDGGREYRDLSAAELRERCRFGPAYVTVAVSDGRPERLWLRVGEPDPRAAKELGAVSATAAVEWLTGAAARTLPERGGEALFAATLADAEWAPAMLALAKDRGAPDDARRNAIFWTSQAAGEKAAVGLHSILADDSEELELRKHAVFALTQIRSEQSVTTLLDLAEHSPEPELRKVAFFWLGQKAEDPRVMELFERVLLR